MRWQRRRAHCAGHGARCYGRADYRAREWCRRYRVPKPVAGACLFFTSEIGGEISEALYNAVAVVLAYIYRVDQGDVAERPNVDVPRDLRFSKTVSCLRSNHMSARRSHGSLGDLISTLCFLAWRFWLF